MSIISNIGNVGQDPQGPSNARRNARANRHAEQPVDPVNATATPADEIAEPNAAKAKGVLRLLQEGHFQGVADARLRINFSEEIAAIQATATRHTADLGSDEVVTLAAAEIRFLLENDTLDEEAKQEVLAAQDVLEAAVQAAREALAETNPPDIFQFVDDLQAAADEFLATLRDILGIEPIGTTEASVEGDTGAPADATAPAGPATTDVPSPVEEFVSTLTDSLNAVIDELGQALQDISVLPPLSSPMGNGVAFDKFAVALTDTADTSGTGGPSESFDIIA